MQILSLDTSSAKGTVALWNSNGNSAQLELSNGLDHARNLMPAISALLEQNNTVPEEIDRIVVGKGPGSFIGTRIAVVAAQAISAATGIEVEQVSSMKGYTFCRPENDQGKNIYVCKSKANAYTFIAISKDAQCYLEEELPDADFAALITPNDMLCGPLTEKNWNALKQAAGFDINFKSAYPSALNLITNTLSCACKNND